MSDLLFADAAQKTMRKLMDNLSLSSLLSYLTIAKESFEDRTLMIWMKWRVAMFIRNAMVTISIGWKIMTTARFTLYIFP